MNVFTVSTDFDYEGSQLEGIFDSEEKAIEFAKKHIKENNYSLVSIQVWELNSSRSDDLYEVTSHGLLKLPK